MDDYLRDLRIQKKKFYPETDKGYPLYNGRISMPHYGKPIDLGPDEWGPDDNGWLSTYFTIESLEKVAERIKNGKVEVFKDKFLSFLLLQRSTA